MHGQQTFATTASNFVYIGTEHLILLIICVCLQQASCTTVLIDTDTVCTKSFRIDSITFVRRLRFCAQPCPEC